MKLVFLFFLSLLSACSASQLSLIPRPYLAPQYLALASAPSNTVIAEAGEPGKRLTVSGQVLAGQAPLANVSLYVFHTDVEGRYALNTNNFDGELNPRLYGLIRTNAEGRYQFTTIRPGSYNNNPAHIHYVLRAEGYRPRLVDLWFQDDSIIAARRKAGEPVVPSAIYDSTVCRSLSDCVVISPIEKVGISTWHAVRDIQMFRQ